MSSKEEDPFADPEKDVESNTDASSGEDTSKSKAEPGPEQMPTLKPESEPETTSEQVPEGEIEVNANVDEPKNELEDTYQLKPKHWSMRYLSHRHLEISLEKFRASSNQWNISTNNATKRAI